MSKIKLFENEEYYMKKLKTNGEQKNKSHGSGGQTIVYSV